MTKHALIKHAECAMQTLDVFVTAMVKEKIFLLKSFQNNYIFFMFYSFQKIQW